MTEKQRINMDIDKHLWKQVSIKSAEMEMEKKEVVEEALKQYLNIKEEK